ncbi:hypothetical protein [Rhizobium wenxiniae]|uniref:hypothetical protein n=1 Tax=Rhizobium wenxiniae TaxID=1737357 RepID=UPI003C15983C
MIHFEEFMPEDFEKLASELREVGSTQVFLTSVQDFLLSLHADDGADEDHAYVIGKRLSKAGIWKNVPSRGLRLHVRDVPKALVEAFLSDAPEEYVRNVLNPPKEKARDHRESTIVGRARTFLKRTLPTSLASDAVDLAAVQSHRIIADQVFGSPKGSSAKEVAQAAGALKKGMREARGPELGGRPDPELVKILAAIEDKRSHDHR